MNLINPQFLLKMYAKGFFPMAKNSTSMEVEFYKPYQRLLIPILDFHIPKRLFKDLKKKIIFLK